MSGVRVVLRGNEVVEDRVLAKGIEPKLPNDREASSGPIL